MRAVQQPSLIAEAAGVTYSQFTIPEKFGLKGELRDYGKRVLELVAG